MAAALVVAPVVGVTACGSVPDVTFADEDGSTLAQEAGADARAADAAPSDAAPSSDAGSGPDCGTHTVSGVCCPSGVFCQKCTPNECSKCPTSCPGSQVCCNTNGNRYDCTASQSC